MKPKHLPRLWCALQGLLPLDGRRVVQRAEAAGSLSPPERETDNRISDCDRHLRAVLSVVSKETKTAT